MKLLCCRLLLQGRQAGRQIGDAGIIHCIGQHDDAAGRKPRHVAAFILRSEGWMQRMVQIGTEGMLTEEPDIPWKLRLELHQPPVQLLVHRQGWILNQAEQGRLWN